MDAQDMDAALDAALKDLEHNKTRTHDAALIAAVVLIGRRLVPARSSTTDETMPGRRSKMGGYREPRTEDSGAALRQDPPRPVVHDRIVGAGPAVDRAMREIWRKDRAELGAALDRNAAQRATIATLQNTLADRNRTITEQSLEITDLRRGLRGSGGANAELLGMAVRARERVAMLERERDGWIRSFSKVGDALGCTAVEPAVLAAIGGLKEALDAAREVAADQMTRASDLENHLAEADVERAESVGKHAALRSSLRSSLRSQLGLPANALDSVIVAKVREMGDVLKVAHEQIETARATLAGAVHEPAPHGLPDLAERAARQIAVLLEEHQRERTAVDELRLQVATLTAAGEDAERAYQTGVTMWRLAHPDDRSLIPPTRCDLVAWSLARWQRIQPLIMMLHAWSAGRPGQDVDTPLAAAFDRWQQAEAAALNAEEAKPTPALRALFGGPPVDGPDPVGALADMPDEPVDVPHQPDDEPDALRRVLVDRIAIVAYLRRMGTISPGYRPAMEAAADAIARGAHVGTEATPTNRASPPPPRTCHPGDRCAGYPECESCGPVRM